LYVNFHNTRWIPKGYNLNGKVESASTIPQGTSILPVTRPHFLISLIQQTVFMLRTQNWIEYPQKQEKTAEICTASISTGCLFQRWSLGWAVL